MKIEEFERLDLRIGRIKDAARMEGSKKLIKLEVDIGDEYGRNRQLVAGIADEYKPVSYTHLTLPTKRIV